MTLICKTELANSVLQIPSNLAPTFIDGLVSDMSGHSLPILGGGVWLRWLNSKKE
jgi:hypothetical protein